MNQSITITNITIHQDAHGRFSLNDLHKAAGDEPRHRPSRWLENPKTKDLIEEISSAGIPALVAINGGRARGTYGCKEVVYAYATWISPAFFLKVIRTYDSLVTPGRAVSGPPTPALPEVITPANLNAMLDKPMQITVREYLALTQGQSGQLMAHSNGQHYSDDLRAQVLALGDKGWMPAEIAERTGVPRDTVATMLFRARKAGKIAKGPRQGTRSRDAKKGGVQ